MHSVHLNVDVKCICNSTEPASYVPTTKIANPPSKTIPRTNEVERLDLGIP